LDPVHERGSETPIGFEAHDVVDAVIARDFCRTIRTAVVDDQDFDAVDAVNLLGQFRQRDGKGFLLVEARDLNHQLHFRLFVPVLPQRLLWGELYRKSCAKPPTLHSE
jgi:hypothetical protein